MTIHPLFKAKPGRCRGAFHLVGVLLALTVILAACKPTATPPEHQTEKPRPDVSFKPQEVTDALHGVIAADRAMYAQHVLQRFADARGLKSGRDWKEKGILPLHADLTRLASQAVQQKGAEFHYVLRSLSPVSPQNTPQTEIEAKGLKQLMEKPEANFYSEEFLGGRRYFTAVYPEKAALPVCVECHNQENPARKDAKLGDLLGGIVVRVPLEF